VKESAYENLAKGAPLYKPGVVEMPESLNAGALCTVYTESGKFVSLSRAVLNDDVVARPERVIV